MKSTLSECFACALLVASAAGNVTVTTLADENNGSLDPGLGTGTSLREAVVHAAAGSVIDFAPSLSGQTLLLNAGQISFGKNLTLDASSSAAGVTVSGNDSSRVFDIPAARTVSIIRLKIVHGDDGGDGGGIRNAGNLSLAGCELTDNHAGDGGGAIENSGPLTLTACTLAGNQAAVGGGAIEHTANTLALVNCTLTGNTAEFGGAIDGDGSSILQLRSCTIAANHATNDGGGIEETSGTLLLENTIVAGNTALDQGPDLKTSGIDTQGGVNLVSSVAGLGGGFSGLVAAPQLAALGSHGGATRTMPPLAGSPAINAGGTTTLTVDQRGLARVVGGVTDIGAVEVQPANLVTTTADAGPGSLRQVVLDAPAGATIIFDYPLDASTITLASPVVLAKNLTLDAAAREDLAISGSDATGLFTVNAGVAATMVGLEMRDGSRFNGGAIRNSGQLALVDCVVSSCLAWDGGAISNASGAALTLADCELSRNFASYDGGGLDNQGSATLTRVSVTDNVAGEDGGFGGGIHNTGNLVISDSVVSGNDAQHSGGIASFGSVALTRVTVAGNRAWDGGAGGLLATGLGGTITASTLSGNSCLGSGGGVFHGGGDLQITNSTFAANASDFEFGGAIATFAPDAKLLDVVACTIAGNEAGEEGGGIYIEPGSRLRLENSIVAGNSAFTAAPDLRGAIETQAGVNLVASTAGIDGVFGGIVAPPQLGPLADNGGPTWTMLPLPGSPVVDAGGTTTLPVDQRGAARVAGPAADIGAVELQESDADSEPPTRPLALTLTAKTASSLSLTWDASTDETSLAGYDVHLDGVLAGTPSSNVFTVFGLEENRSYTLRVRARDFADNVSTPSNALLATPQADGLQVPPEAVRTEFRAIVLNYNPNILVNGVLVPADTHYGNRNVDELIAQYIGLMRKASGGQMNWTVTQRFDLDEWAPAAGSPSPVYTAENCVTLVSQGYHYPASYPAIIHDPRFDIVDRTNQGELDAVWVFGAFGLDFAETAMAGPSAVYINGGPVPDATLDQNIVFYGFGKQGGQGVGFMCENTAHMAEVLMGYLQPAWPRTTSAQTFTTLNFNDPTRELAPKQFTDWVHFVQAEASSWDRDLVAPGRAQCGLSHYPPTALYNYNWNTFHHEFDGADPFVAIDGTWLALGGEYRVLSGNGVKTLAFDPLELHEGPTSFHPVEAFSDADVEFSVRVMNGATPSHAGLLFRVFNAAAGANQAKGYYLGLNANQDQVLLAKLDHAFIPLASAPFAADAGTSHRLRLEARGSQLRVYSGSSLTPLISLNDASYLTGGFGFCTYGTEAFFDKLDIVAHVTSKADKWYGYPDAEADARDLTPLEWDGDTPRAMDGFYAWWWEHLPKNGGGHYASDLVTGQPSLLLNTWWPYIYDHNRFKTTQPYPDIIFPPEDVSPPTPPAGVQTLAMSGSEVALAWEPADDDVGVTRYAIFRDGQFLRKTASPHLNDTRLAPNITYTYEIMACDGSGNISEAVEAMVTTLAVEAAGMVTDGDFEFPAPEAAGWLTGAFRPGDAVFAWEPPDAGRLGTAGVSIDATDFNDASWYQTVDGLLPGETYWLTGWIKGEGIEPEPGFPLGANLSLSGTFEHTGPLTGTFDWQQASMTFVAPPTGSVTIACRIGFYGNLTRGKAWFDDIAVVRHPIPRLTEPEILPSGHFRCVLLAPEPDTYTLEKSSNLLDWTTVRALQVLHPDVEIIELREPGSWFYRASND
jgi:chitodextrinase